MLRVQYIQMSGKHYWKVIFSFPIEFTKLGFLKLQFEITNMSFFLKSPVDIHLEKFVHPTVSAKVIILSPF